MRRGDLPSYKQNDKFNPFIELPQEETYRPANERIDPLIEV
jgi:hypothetical protein